jgi:hypothetical protein
MYIVIASIVSLIVGFVLGTVFGTKWENIAINDFNRLHTTLHDRITTLENAIKADAVAAERRMLNSLSAQATEIKAHITSVVKLPDTVPTPPKQTNG